MQVEDVARISLASGRTAEDERDFAVGHGLLAEVVVDDERGAACVAEVLADRGSRERRIVLERSRVRCGGGDDDSIIHSALGAKGFHDICHGRTLLTHSYIDAVDRFALEILAALVDDGVYGDGGLAGLAVADDEFALTASDRDHGVY